MVGGYTGGKKRIMTDFAKLRLGRKQVFEVEGKKTSTSFIMFPISLQFA